MHLITAAALFLASFPADDLPPSRGGPGKPDVREFVKRGFYEGMPYKEAKAAFGAADVPALHGLLDEADYAPHWGNVARLIGYLSRDPKSVPALLRYARRADDWKGLERVDGYRRVLAKVEAVSSLGLVGGDGASEALRGLFAEAGAAALVKGWGDRPGAFGMDRDRATALVRGRAALGLVFTRRAADVALVEKAYRAEHAACRERKVVTKWYSELVSAMAARDLIAAKGLDGYLGLRGTGKDFEAIKPYVEKYAWRYEDKRPPAPKKD